MSLLQALIEVSEKAANIARLCRQDEHLFQLLVQEKKSDEANPRFVQDFKTLADVLIQETVKHDVGRQFLGFEEHVKGEENNTFCNKLGETICVQILNQECETANLLQLVLNDDEEAAKLLAAEVHRDVKLTDVNVARDFPNDELNYSEIGIWVDPIDSTAEYISGVESIDQNGIFISGLKCVTVLLGVYDRNTGAPVIGVVNQPFYEQIDGKWHGRCYWGISTATTKASSIGVPTELTNTICVSSSENGQIKNKLRQKGFTLAEAAGAGYKILTVITGQADAYVLSKDSTFKWDTCGPQAILRALDGDVFNYSEADKYISVAYSDKQGESNQIGNKATEYCNTGGIIACRNKTICKSIIDILKDY